MPTIYYQQKKYPCHQGETILNALIRGGADVTFSCRDGVCNVCLLRAQQGSVPQEAQNNLHKSLVKKKYFHACTCIPKTDMKIEKPKKSDLLTQATVIQKDFLAKDICRIRLKPSSNFVYKPGNFINIWMDEHTAKPYSLASVPEIDGYLELQIRRFSDGNISRWICDVLQEGDCVAIQGADGNCIYHERIRNDKLLLIGTSTGISPLYGIVRDALYSGHKQEILLYHLDVDHDLFYLKEQLQSLAHKYPNFKPVFSLINSEEDYQSQSLEFIFDDIEQLDQFSIFACGHGDIVSKVSRKAKEANISRNKVFQESFFKKQSKKQQNDPEFTEEPRKYPPPNPEMWAALQNGKLLRTILEDFYTDVFKDPLLSPYFAHTNKEHLIAKQYSFLYQVFTGEDVYFGLFPRNAHHWMVISDEIFDYREALMNSKLKKHGLPQKYIDILQKFEESFRNQIVKKHPWKKISHGVEYPVDGYGETVLELDIVCDGCGREILKGETAKYHLHLGTAYCKECIVE